MKHSIRLSLVLCFLFLSGIARGQESKYWNWSDPSPAHHSAVRVMVEQTDGARLYASGIYIEYGKLKGVLTVAHVMRNIGKLRILTQDGKESTKCVDCWTNRDGHDISFIIYENKELTPLKLAERGPVVGGQYEMIPLVFSIKNPKARLSELRAFYMNCVESLNQTGQKDQYNIDYYDGYTISGDSGAAILNSNDEVVGIQSSGYDFTGNTIGVKRIHRGSLSTKHSLIVAFLNRLQTHETQLG